MAAPARLQIDRRRGEPALRCRGPSANSAHDRGRGRLDRLRGASVCLAPRHDLLAREQRCVQRQPGAARSCGTLAAAARLSGRGPVVEIGGLRRLVHEHDRSRDVRSNTTLSSRSIKSTSASPGCCRWQTLRALPCCRIPPATRGTESPSATGEPRRSVAVPVDQGWRQPDRAAGRNAPRGVCTRRGLSLASTPNCCATQRIQRTGTRSPAPDGQMSHIRTRQTTDRYGMRPTSSSACWNVGRLTHSISGWVIAPSARNWIESEHIWSPAEHTPSAG